MAYLRPKDLPDFDRPPVTEVVLSLQFASLRELGNIHAGLLWQRFREAYPGYEEKPAIDPVFETFGLPVAQSAAPQFKMVTSPPMSRYWFLSADSAELLQVQQDRLIHNWRERPGENQSAENRYPRYEPLRERFFEEVGALQAFLNEGNLGQLLVNQCEVTYINHIFLDGADPAAQLEEVFTIWAGKHSDGYLPEPEKGQFLLRYLLKEHNGVPWGRLIVAAVPAVHNLTNLPVVQLTLTARGKPRDESMVAAFERLDEGRSAVVRGFASLTTTKMHERWGRINASK